MNFYELLSEESKARWAGIYKVLTGKKWQKPAQDERGITCETKVEDTEEIARLMSEKQNPVGRK